MLWWWKCWVIFEAVFAMAALMFKTWVVDTVVVKMVSAFSVVVSMVVLLIKVDCRSSMMGMEAMLERRHCV